MAKLDLEHKQSRLGDVGRSLSGLRKPISNLKMKEIETLLLQKSYKKKIELIEKWLGPKVIVSYSEICLCVLSWLFLEHYWKSSWGPLCHILKSVKSNVCLTYRCEEEFTSAMTHGSHYMKYVHMCWWSFVTVMHLMSQVNLVPFCASVIMAVQTCSASCDNHFSYVLSSSQIISQVALGVMSYPFWCSLMNILVLCWYK